MGNTMYVTGYFSRGRAKPLQGRVQISYFARGGNDTLTVLFPGCYQVDLPFRPVRQLIASVRRESAGSTAEQQATATGYYTDVSLRLVPGPVSLWFRRREQVEMLTVEFAEMGQISIPFAPVSALIADAQRGLA